MYNLCLLLCLIVSPAMAQNFANARVLSADFASEPARMAAKVLKEEIEKRTGANRAGDGILVLAFRHEVGALIDSKYQRQWRAWLETAPSPQKEGYSLLTLGPYHIIAGDDDRGLLFGVGHTLRKLDMRPNRAVFSQRFSLTTSPDKSIRIHQIGYRFKNNSYDAFNPHMFEQHVRDLLVFGSNGIQWIAPISDDAAESPLFPLPAQEMLYTVSGLLKRYGLDFHLYYPLMGRSYADAAVIARETERFEGLVRSAPHISSLFVPGGDPGHTEPELFFPMVSRLAAVLGKYHPEATVWISAQGFDRREYERFYQFLASSPAWLTGVFVGPQSRDDLKKQRSRISPPYRVLFYPDIAHTLHSQFPIPDFDPAFALTEGREPINPQPRAQTHIYRHFAPWHDGFVTYSEGVADDFNKMLWTRAGWHANHDPTETLKDYGRYFLGNADAGLLNADLEQNWDGPLAVNKEVLNKEVVNKAVASTKICMTLSKMERLRKESLPGFGNNWRMNMMLYRAVYDAYVQRRALAERERENRAYRALKNSDPGAARAALETPDDAGTQWLRKRLFQLAEKLFQETGLQLSVALYGASHWERGANLDRVDVSLNDKVWLLQQLDAMEALSSPQARKARLAQLARRDAPPAGGFYDDVGDPTNSPHVVRGSDFSEDPMRMRGVINSIADRTPDDGWRMAWITYAEALYETPLVMYYEGLDKKRAYRLRITYSGEDYSLPIKLVANGKRLHDFTPRASNPMEMSIDIPSGLLVTGDLKLVWMRPDGMGGSGRGRQVSQVWLYPAK